MVLSLLFNGIPQKTVASSTNYTDRGQEHQRSIMVKRQAYDGLPGSVKAILTLFFL